jgi:hypothetical protein
MLCAFAEPRFAVTSPPDRHDRLASPAGAAGALWVKHVQNYPGGSRSGASADCRGAGCGRFEREHVRRAQAVSEPTFR